MSDNNLIKFGSNTREIYDTSRCQDLLAAFLRDDYYPTLAERQRLVEYLNTETVESMIAKNYPEAGKYNSYKSLIFAGCLKHNRSTQVENQTAQIRNKIRKLTEELDARKEKKVVSLEKLQAIEQERVSELEQEHLTQLETFEKYWYSERSLREFNKPTPEMLTLQSHERSLLLANEYEEAAKLTEELKRIESRQTRAAQKMAEEAYQVRKTLLVRKQKAEIKSLRCYYQSIFDAQVKKHDLQIQRLELRITKFQTDLDSGCIKPSIPSSLDTFADSKKLPVPIASPRTRGRLHEIRSQCPARTLKLNPPITQKRSVSDKNDTF